MKVVKLMLSGLEILRQIQNPELNNIEISGFDIKRLNPNSYNLTLANKLIVYTNKQLDPKLPNPTDEIIIPESGYLLEPGILYLGRTNEFTKTDGFVPVISGRSSIGRLGINIHATAGFGDIGFTGTWTLELFVIHPVIIYPNMEICQIYYERIIGDPTMRYKGKYLNQFDPVSSRMYTDNSFNKE